MAQPKIIPRPAHLTARTGVFQLTERTPLIVVGKDADLQQTVRLMSERLSAVTLFTLTPRAGSGSEKNAVVVSLDPARSASGRESYSLTVTPEGVHIAAPSAAGAFYGLQTLFQLVPTPARGKTGSVAIPCLEIVDAPRFAWRGMHLDVSRHFFPKEFIKKYLDILALHKMNVFHWHLTDDQGWRLEIRKYPRLTSIGAWRVDRERLEWNARPPQQPGETATYGGFYTQEDVREIVAYAAQRNIMIVPEIEMPAHSVAALSTYPEYSCAHKALTVLPGGYWPNVDIFCAGNDSTFLFLQDVLDEVIRLFPGPYIHVGGDEADKTEWKKCPRCQERIRAEGLKDEGELQSYFIKRIERYVVAHGRRLIGWDEIIEGGLPPEAMVMSWRGIVGGISAARQQHDVVMTPTDNCYFDYYQGNPAYEPQAIGGFLPLSKVYAYEPMPDSLTAEEARHILGVQANLWTEYIQTTSHAEYMALPRMAAVAEVAWTPGEGRSWDDFARRVPAMFHRYKALGYNFARSGYLVNAAVKIDSVIRRATCVLSTELPVSAVRYTLDGSDPVSSSPLYSVPLILDSSVMIRATAFGDTGRISPVTEQQISLHRACFMPVTLAFPYEKYDGGGPGALTNGIRGTRSYSDGSWQGFHGVDVDAIVDLGSVQPIRRMETSFLQNVASWIFLPVSVRFLVSADGLTYEEAGAIRNENPGVNGPIGVQVYPQTFVNTRARYVRIAAKSIGVCPEWHPGKGEKAWLFIDEIVVE